MDRRAQEVAVQPWKLIRLGGQDTRSKDLGAMVASCKIANSQKKKDAASRNLRMLYTEIMTRTIFECLTGDTTGGRTPGQTLGNRARHLYNILKFCDAASFFCEFAILQLATIAPRSFERVS